MRTGLLGGTFDPVHTGHLDAALAARDALALDEVLMLPAKVPPHRADGPQVSAYHRFAMIALAVLDRPGLLASDLELRGPSPSYTAATLERLAHLGRDPLDLFFITGADAFAEIATWRDYPGLLDRAHFAVVARTGHPVSALRSALPLLSDRMIDVDQPPLDRRVGTAIFLVDRPTTAISSTAVRLRLRNGAALGGLLPASVERYIRQHHLYAPLITAADDLHG
jgi:nicotinate-nucleotide adenylyltransferase